MNFYGAIVPEGITVWCGQGVTDDVRWQVTATDK
jgi:hypothetical protein